MKFGKWIGGAVGFMTMGPLGALAGYAIGSLFDRASEGVQPIDDQAKSYDNTAQYEGQRNSFLFSMLVLASYIIQADQKVMHSEMEFVRRFLRQRFGDRAEMEGELILLELFEKRKEMNATDPNAFKKTILECGQQIQQNLTEEQRLQLLNFLVQIAQSDGQICALEIEALKDVALAMGLTEKDLNAMMHLKADTLEAAYQVLEIDPSATDEEVKNAFRKMALKHHPDRVATLGEDIRKAAEEKFREINNAKERIFKARGIR